MITGAGGKKIQCWSHLLPSCRWKSSLAACCRQGRRRRQNGLVGPKVAEIMLIGGGPAVSTEQVAIRCAGAGNGALTMPSPSAERAPATDSRPPAWLMLATGALAVTFLVLAVGETSLWVHYLIDGGGEFLSLFGL